MTSNQCADCGMPVNSTEYHPYAACLMFKACHDGRVVQDNLDAVVVHGMGMNRPAAETTCEHDYVWREAFRYECDKCGDISHDGVVRKPPTGLRHVHISGICAPGCPACNAQKTSPEPGT